MLAARWGSLGPPGDAAGEAQQDMASFLPSLGHPFAAGPARLATLPYVRPGEHRAAALRKLQWLSICRRSAKPCLLRLRYGKGVSWPLAVQGRRQAAGRQQQPEDRRLRPGRRCDWRSVQAVQKHSLLHGHAGLPWTASCLAASTCICVMVAHPGCLCSCPKAATMQAGGCGGGAAAQRPAQWHLARTQRSGQGGQVCAKTRFCQLCTAAKQLTRGRTRCLASLSSSRLEMVTVQGLQLTYSCSTGLLPP